MKTTRVVKKWPIRLVHGRFMTGPGGGRAAGSRVVNGEAGRTKEGVLVFRIKGSTTFGRWSTPGPVFAYIAEKQEPREG